MNNRLTTFGLAWVLLFAGLLGLGWGCGKRAVSSSGDQSTVASESRPAAPVENIQPDRMVTVPDVKQAPIETARETVPPSSPPSESPPSRTPAQAVSPAPVTPGPALAPAVTDAPAMADVYFDFDRYVIRKDGQPVLEANGAWIKNAPAASILIEGHCDERGTLAYNLVLGEKRARAAKHYLEDLGIPASRLKIISYGEVRPFCREHEESCYQKNRRAHFVPQ
jgi:peptidoglycan-associated lipoprotein